MKHKPYKEVIEQLNSAPTIYTIVVTHNSGRAVIVETHACIKHAKHRINRLVAQYTTNDKVQPYKVTFTTTKLQLPQGE